MQVLGEAGGVEEREFHKKSSMAHHLKDCVKWILEKGVNSSTH